jgi:nucleotide-binding universal stress UspA family protein
VIVEPDHRSVRRVVVGVDGSAASLRALQFAADLAEDLRAAELVVVYVRHISGFWMPEHVAEDEFADVLDAAEATVKEAASQALADRVMPWHLDVREGEPAHVLCDIAHEAAARSVIVVGRSGWSTFRELMLGSVSNRLVHRPDCTVLLAQ